MRRFAPVLLLVAIDLWSKAAAFRWLEGARLTYDEHGHGRIPLLGDWFAFRKALNPGMAWGWEWLPPHVLVFGRVLASLFLIVLLVRVEHGRKLLTWALVLILAGALGNLHDNLLLDSERHPFGEVRDFIDVYFGAWNWHFPTFNFADSCITVGAVLLFASSLFDKGRSGAAESGDGVAEPAELK